MKTTIQSCQTSPHISKIHVHMSHGQKLLLLPHTAVMIKIYKNKKNHHLLRLVPYGEFCFSFCKFLIFYVCTCMVDEEKLAALGGRFHGYVRK